MTFMATDLQDIIYGKRFIASTFEFGDVSDYCEVILNGLEHSKRAAAPYMMYGM